MKPNSPPAPVAPKVPASQEGKEGDATRKLYNKLVRQARLVAILLTSIKFDVNRDVDYDGKVSSLKLHYNGEVVRLHFDETQGAIFARIRWEVQVKIQRRNYAKCTAEYDTIYDGFGSDAADVVSHFADSVARPASYAYFRALFSSLDWGAELRLPPLPVFKVQPKV